MKFLGLVVCPVEKLAELAAVADKAWLNEPRQNRPEANYMMLCVPQFDVPPNSVVAFTISDSDSADNISARIYPEMLTGATVQVIPLLEVPIGGGTKAEKKYKH